IVIPDETEAKSLVEQLKGAQWRVAEVTRKERKDQPSTPFSTSLLQQQASVRLRFSPKKTMMIAQQLYEGVDLPEGSTALVTYIRTDSFRVSEDAIKECRDFVAHKYGEKFLNEQVRRYRSKKSAQEAHEAIRPTYVNLVPDEIKGHLTPDQYKLYQLIWNRFVATQMKPAEWLMTRGRVEATPANPIQIKIAGPDKGDKISFTAQHAFFTATAQKLVFSGYLEITNVNPVNEASSEEDEEEASEKLSQKDAGEVLAVLKENDSLNLEQLTPDQHFTKAPPRYSEASLVKMLEKYDIGRPSTYAPIISTIQGRGYVRRFNRYLFATDLGILVTDKLQDFFEDIMNTDFTAQMEDKLDLVEEAKTEWLTLLKDFYKVFEKDLEKAKFGMTKEKGMESEGGEKCEKCSAPMVIRWSRRGKFLACSKYPDCMNTQSITSPLDSDMEKALEQINEACPKCSKRMVVKSGPRGRFLACPGYPECKSTKPIRPYLPKLDE
ncbi:DNA topoisomerase, partial [Planctomycetota bacterium]